MDTALDPSGAYLSMTARSGIGERFAGGVLLVAAAIMFIGVAIGFLAPSLREAPPFVTDDVAEVAAAIAGNPTAWAWAHALIATAAVLTTLGLVPLSIRFEDRSRPWALMGLVAFALGAVLEVVDRAAVGVTIWAAERYPDPTVIAVFEAFDRADDGLGSAFYLLAFVAIGLYGVAMTRSNDTRELGWGFVIGATVGVLIGMIGAGIPVFVYLGTAALGIATWRLGVTAPIALESG